MQIAGVLQVLAMSDDTDKELLKAQDLYSKFRPNCVSDILHNIISTNKLRNNGVMSGLSDLLSLSIPQFDTQTNVLLTSATDNGVFKGNSNVTGHSSLLNRSAVMIALPDIHKLIIFLRQICKERADLLIESDEIRWLKSILPLDYIQQALEREATALNNASNASRVSQVSLPSNKSSITAESPECVGALLRDHSNEATTTNSSDGFQGSNMLKSS
jgi:hypothetical protein